MIHDHVIGYSNLAKIFGTRDRCQDFKGSDMDLCKKKGWNLDGSTKLVFRLMTGITFETF